MRTRAWLSAGLVGAAMLGIGCSKKDSRGTVPETAAGMQPTRRRQRAGRQDSISAAEGAYRDTAAAAAGAAGDSAAAAAGLVGDSAAADCRTPAA